MNAFTLKSLRSIFLLLTFGVGVALAGCGGEETRQDQALASNAKPEVWKPEDAALKAKAEAEARTFEDIYFDVDRHDIPDHQQAALTRNAEKMKAHPAFKVTIEGHCDERGTAEYNMALGQRRAESARVFLVEAGVASDRLTTVSYGEERPADPGHNEEAWARNRRAAFVVTEPSLSAIP